MKDFSCYLGAWPFYKLPASLDALRALHAKNGIYGGYVSSLQSMFYNDFYESEKELSEILAGSEYRQLVTLNPTLSFAEHTLRRCTEEFDVAGVRIHPTYHGYSMDSKSLVPIVKILREKRLPLFITGRITDDRTTYLIEPKPIDTDALRRFIKKNPDIKIVLSHFKLADEVRLVNEDLSDNLLLDSVGFTGNAFEEPGSHALYNKAVYGSGYPLMCITTGALIVNNELPENVRQEFVKREV